MVKKPSELINGPQNGVLSANEWRSRQSQPTGSGNGLTTLIVVVLACVLGYLALTRIDWGDGDRKQDDHHEQNDDDKKQDDKKQDNKTVAAKPGYLMIVSERISGIDDSLSVARIADFCAKQRAAGIKLEYRNPDDDDDSEPVRKLIAHAASKNIQPPFLLFKSEDKDLLGVIKLPPPDATDAQILEVFRSP